jgi:hypothetical protein
MFGGLSPAENDGFLKAIKIRSTTSFGVQVKPLAPCHMVLWHVREPYRYERYFVGKIHVHLRPSFSCFITRCLCWYLPENSGA